MSHQKQITRLYKWEIYLGWWGRYYTRKSRKKKILSPFQMSSSSRRTKIRVFENRRYRRNKLSTDNWKKYWINYKWSIY